METLMIEPDGYIKFLIEFEGDFEVSANFKVYEVISWYVGGEIVDTQLYLKGEIKWDGCSNICFGDDDGCLHLCGRSYFERHKQVMDAIWDICSKKITMFDHDIAS